MADFTAHIETRQQRIEDWRSALLGLLVQLDVPKNRLELNEGDFAWLSRNLRIRNSEHPVCEDAIKIIIRLLKAGVR